MNRRVFISGTGTGIGKTVVAAIVTQHLRATYWKPVQAGYDDGTDSTTVESLVPGVDVYPEVYKLKLPASPHIAARQEGLEIHISRIVSLAPASGVVVVEGAGGLMVPLNDTEFVIDLVAALDADLILVSRNELGSINHSLLTAEACRHRNLKVLGWIFNGNYLNYEEEIVRWTNLPRLGSVPQTAIVDAAFIREQAVRLKGIT